MENNISSLSREEILDMIMEDNHLQDDDNVDNDYYEGLDEEDDCISCENGLCIIRLRRNNTNNSHKDKNEQNDLYFEWINQLRRDYNEYCDNMKLREHA